MGWVSFSLPALWLDVDRCRAASAPDSTQRPGSNHCGMRLDADRGRTASPRDSTRRPGSHHCGPRLDAPHRRAILAGDTKRRPGSHHCGLRLDADRGWVASARDPAAVARGLTERLKCITQGNVSQSNSIESYLNFIINNLRNNNSITAHANKRMNK